MLKYKVQCRKCFELHMSNIWAKRAWVLRCRISSSSGFLGRLQGIVDSQVDAGSGDNGKQGGPNPL